MFANYTMPGYNWGMSDIVLQVAMKAVIVKDGKVLVLREAGTYEEGTNEGRYDMPGGRLEPGEPFEEALRREVREETGLEVSIEYPIYVGEWRPVIRDVPHQIVATFMVCAPTSAKIVLSSDHDEYQWVDPQDYGHVNILDPVNKVIDRYAEWAARLGQK
jgi:8-oxo-dGTP diphosphatase